MGTGNFVEKYILNLNGFLKDFTSKEFVEYVISELKGPVNQETATGIANEYVERITQIINDDINEVTKLGKEFIDIDSKNDMSFLLATNLQEQKKILEKEYDDVKESNEKIGPNAILIDKLVEMLNQLDEESTKITAKKQEMNLEETNLNVLIGRVNTILEQDETVLPAVHLDDALCSYLTQTLTIPNIHI